MQYRKDIRSGNNLSVLGFGCMRLPGTLGNIDFDKAEKLFLDAVSQGINYFDTAYLYPTSEVTLGRFIKKHSLRDKLFIATKLPIASCGSAADFDKFFNEQLERLQTNYIDYYLMHNISSFSQWEQLCSWGIENWIAEKKKSGQIKQAGFSFHGTQHDFSTLLDRYDWDFCQIQYNYININYQAGLAGLKKAAEKGLPVFIMEPLLGGQLATKLPKKAAELFRKANASLTPAGWALKWLWNQEEVTLVLSGMNQKNQLDENCKVAQESPVGVMTKAEAQTVEKVIDVFNDSYKIPCTGCNYCMPCPQKINIPACFTAYNSSYSISLHSGIYHHTVSCSGLTDTPHFASSCIQCGNCENHCPQHIPIRSALKNVRKRLEPFGYKGLLSIYRKFRKP